MAAQSVPEIPVFVGEEYVAVNEVMVGIGYCLFS